MLSVRSTRNSKSNQLSNEITVTLVLCIVIAVKQQHFVLRTKQNEMKTKPRRRKKIKTS